jgi:cytochrome c
MKTKLFLSILFTSSLFAQDPFIIYQKKCAMCHIMVKPHDMEENKKIVAPPMPVAMRSVVIGTDAIEMPESEAELRKLSIAFLIDYVQKPSQDKGYCEDKSYRRFGAMPSLKGFITKKQIDIVIPWIYDNFKPKKDKNGKYKVSSKKSK